MANPLTDAFSPVLSAVTTKAAPATSGGWSTTITIVVLIIVIALVSIVGAFIWFYYSEKKAWNIITRVHYENPTINGVNIGGAVLTKRVRFKDGRVVYMYKTPIQGYTISPELLTWSRPREHDIIVTQDKKVFCLVGLDSIDVQRKKLKVDISYPDIEMDRQDLQQHIDSKKFDDPNERLKLLAKVAIWIFVCITVIVVCVLGGKSYVEGKNADSARDQANMRTAQLQQLTVQDMNTFILILSKVMPESFQAVDGQNLLKQLNVSNLGT
jgi:heme/copper-type cytochrome/quinol oxidase subunit 2